MKISKKSQYGLRAMVELTLHQKEGSLSAKAVSEKQNIPLQYLEQIFNRLKKKGLVKTIRGPGGGYVLSREPSRIKMRDIMETLEDKNFLIDCLVKKRSSCSMIDTCTARKFWEKLNKSIKGVLDSTTLQDLCQVSKKDKETENNIEHRYTFQI